MKFGIYLKVGFEEIFAFLGFVNNYIAYYVTNYQNFQGEITGIEINEVSDPSPHPALTLA